MDNPSIGAINTIEYDSVSDRSKGFLASMHSTAEQVSHTLGQIGETHRRGTRLTVRILLSESIDTHLVWCMRMPWKTHADLACEALIPVHRRGLGAIGYFGANVADRRASAVTRFHEWALLEKTRQGLEKSPSRVLASGFRIEMLSRLSDGDVRRLGEIYEESFQSYGTDLSPASIAAMVHKNITAVVRNPIGEIVAVSQAECAPFSIDGNAWRLIELSETATHPASRSMGFSQVCKAALIGALHGPDAVIYAESRANHAAVLRSNQRVGFQARGRLERHCLMDSSAKEFSQEGAYANLFVFSL